jgi:hypothetical protein
MHINCWNSQGERHTMYHQLWPMSYRKQ